MAQADIQRQKTYGEDLSQLNKNGSGDFIRLLKVISVSKKHITCDLRVFSLKHAPPYAAVSYCWGNGERDKVVHFSGTPVEERESDCGHLTISTHLYEGLQRLSALNEFGWLWNDAICIDQESKEEKNDQVTRMQSIYSTAKRVYVWLGMCSGSNSLRAASSRFFGISMTKLSRGRGFARAKILALLDRGSDVWWKRTWIIQELCLCPQIGRAHV